MSEQSRQLMPGTLWPMILERTRTARRSGALQPIQTETHVIEDQGVHFRIRRVSSLKRKHAEGAARTPRAASAATRPNPFLPYEQELFVADISDTHVCLLNKYNVIDNHTLIVTRAFEPQESPLTRADFASLGRCMAEYDALAFYNSGPIAGASQPHKHLQLAPLPLTADAPAIPLESSFAPSVLGEARSGQIDRLPFRHVFARLDAERVLDHAAAGAHLHDVYTTMLRALGFDPAERTLAPYNLLVTRRYMLFVPRSRERFDTLPVNALGFAGSFFVPDQAAFDTIRRAGPMAVLQQVAFPRAV